VATKTGCAWENNGPGCDDIEDAGEYDGLAGRGVSYLRIQSGDYGNGSSEKFDSLKAKYQKIPVDLWSRNARDCGASEASLKNFELLPPSGVRGQGLEDRVAVKPDRVDLCDPATGH